MLALARFDLRYESTKATKLHVSTNLLVGHNGLTNYVKSVPWMLFFDASVCHQGSGIILVIVSPQGGIF
jgi:hypothetical protein